MSIPHPSCSFPLANSYTSCCAHFHYPYSLLGLYPLCPIMQPALDNLFPFNLIPNPKEKRGWEKKAAGWPGTYHGDATPLEHGSQASADALEALARGVGWVLWKKPPWL